MTFGVSDNSNTKANKPSNQSKHLASYVKTLFMIFDSSVILLSKVEV
jgi:hypothetical protein